MQELSLVGRSVPRVDALEKVTGSAKYGVDLELPRMLHAKVLRSKHPHARILSIDTSEAEKLPGVRAVVTAKDVLKEKFVVAPTGVPDAYPLAVDKVRYVGQEIGAIAAEDELTAEEALGLIKVEYEELPAVFDPEEAIKPGAPKIHDKERNINWEVDTEYGDVATGFKEADYIVEGRFAMQYVHSCHLQPTLCIASFDSSGKLTFWENSNDAYFRHRLIAKALGIPASKVKIIQKFMGGNFGSSQCESSPYVITALLAKKTGRPVRLVNTRAEEFMSARPRMPIITYLKTGVKKDGTLTARHFRVIATNGGYSGYGPMMLVRGFAACVGLYRCPNVRFEGKCVYTNTVPVGAYRAFGATQQIFAVESHMDAIAEELGMDPVDLRLKNATKTGDVTVVGQKIGSCGLQECIEKVTEYTRWGDKRVKKQPNRGIGMACTMYDSDSRIADFGGSVAYVRVWEDGRVEISSGEYEWGQGSHTVLSQIVAEELGVPLDAVDFPELDTELRPYSLGPYGGGRVTITAGHAVRLAAIDARRQLFALAAKMLGVRPEELELKDQKIFVSRAPEKAVSIADAADYGKYGLPGAEVIGKGVYDPDTVLPDLKKFYGNYSSAYSFHAQIAEVEVDPETGRVKLLSLASAVDLGKAINPMAAEGQVEGGVAQEIGTALTEEIKYEKGIVINPDFTDYKISTAMDIPPIKSFLIETNEPNGPYGAKGFGQATGMPTAAAIANAVYNAVGVRVRGLPITPDKVLKALEEKRGGK